MRVGTKSRNPRGLRRAAGGGDDDGVDGNSAADDGGGHGDGTVAVERVVAPRPTDYEIDPSPPVLKYEDYTAYDVVLEILGSEDRSDTAWNNSYVDMNLEVGLKDYKEHVEEKIDFSGEEGARKEHLYLELQREIEIELKECAADLGRNIVSYEKTLKDYKAQVGDAHFELQRELREKYERYETRAIRYEYQNGKRPSQRTAEEHIELTKRKEADKTALWEARRQVEEAATVQVQTEEGPVNLLVPSESQRARHQAEEVVTVQVQSEEGAVNLVVPSGSETAETLAPVGESRFKFLSPIGRKIFGLFM